jgi:energy-converting hydrogenase Eha subunit C
MQFTDQKMPGLVLLEGGVAPIVLLVCSLMQLDAAWSGWLSSFVCSLIPLICGVMNR